MANIPDEPQASRPSLLEETGASRLRPSINPPPRQRLTSGQSLTPPNSPEPLPPVQDKPRRSKTGKKDKEKRQPTGNYLVGFCRTPAHSQFKDGNPGGPGRPKGSRSQDSIMRDELNRKVTVTVEGTRRKMPKRELAFQILVNKSFESRDPKLLTQLIAHAQQLFPEAVRREEETFPLGNGSLDEQILRDFFAGLAMGEPASNEIEASIEPNSDGHVGDVSDASDTWDEGDWDESGDIWKDDEDDPDGQE